MRGALSASVTIDPALVVGPVRPRTFGSFVERLSVTTVRYPGGSFVSGHRWEDGIGSVEHRHTAQRLPSMSSSRAAVTGWVRAA